MKFLRWAAVVVLSLMSLMNVGVLTGGDDGPSTATVIGAVALGLFGFVAVYGFARREPWGRAAAIAAGALNIVGGVIAMATDTEGGIVGVVLGAIIVVLSFAASDASPARRQSALG
jgi:peptidoglycan/LPS O-acetylase OafA/YrhL